MTVVYAGIGVDADNLHFCTDKNIASRMREAIFVLSG